MESKNDKDRTGKDLPGYPHYPPEEDIERQGQRLRTDVENITRNNEVPRGDTGDEADVTREERELLEDTEQTMPTTDEQRRRQAMPDRTDDDGDLLNEDEGASGSGLDVPGSEADDSMEDIGEEDEENNYYSLNDDEPQ